jgi:hypothetical protein
MLIREKSTFDFESDLGYVCTYLITPARSFSEIQLKFVRNNEEPSGFQPDSVLCR